MTVRIITGDALGVMRTLPTGAFHCCVTSPPYYGLRDYNAEGQIGLESTLDEYIERMVEVFREVRRLLRDDGTLWLNLGDTYSGGGRGGNTNSITGRGANASQLAHARPLALRPKQMLGVPWRVAFALQSDGWFLRQDIIWAKPNPMPESVRDRCTKAHEYLFLLAKSPSYYFDGQSIAENVAPSTVARLAQPGLESQAGSHVPGKTNGPMRAVGGTYSFARETKTEGPPGSRAQHRPDREDIEYRGRRNKRSVWTVATVPFRGAHFATFPPALIEPCILAGCPEGGTVLDPFGGAGTTGLVASRLQRSATLIEINPVYTDMARRRLESEAPLLTQTIITRGGEA